MERESHLVVRILLWVICAYHIVAGIAATLFKDLAVRIGSFLFGVGITMTPQAELLVRYLGALAISFGLMAGFAAIDPERNRKIIYGAVVYFLVRAFDRIAFWKLLDEHTVGPVPNWFRIIAILAFGIALLVFMPKNPAAKEGVQDSNAPDP